MRIMAKLFPPPTFHLPPTRRGQATLSFVILVGGIVALIGITVAFLATSFLNVGFGFDAGERALAVARAGNDDAMLRLVRDKNFASSYDVPVGAYTASVVVTQGAPAAGQATIVSSASVAARGKKIQTVVSVSATTGQVTLVSSTLIP